jgi:hypothetical protein
MALRLLQRALVAEGSGRDEGEAFAYLDWLKIVRQV